MRFHSITEVSNPDSKEVTTYIYVRQSVVPFKTGRLVMKLFFSSSTVSMVELCPSLLSHIDGGGMWQSAY